jgi:septal ring factor EnvC (AmiA/AmiB activator)
MPKSVRDALAQAVQLKQAVADLDQQITARTQQIGEITAEQTRIRENMRTVAPNSQYYDRLLSKLNEQESTIEKVQGERKDLMAKRDAARAELQRYLETLNVN